MIVSECRADGCTSLTIGSYCVAHDLPVTRVFVCGRPFVPAPVRRLPDRAAAAAPRCPLRTIGTLPA
jgi:hypothetical protein